MRVKWWAGFMTIAVAAPVGAHADNRAPNVADFWYSTQFKEEPRLVRDPAALQVPVAQIRPVDTFMRRGFEASSGVGRGGRVAAPRVVPTTATTAPHLTAAPATPAAPAAAPEMNAGFAASGLTLLLGGVAILRGRRKPL
jgi:hypothetical protein